MTHQEHPLTSSKILRVPMYDLGDTERDRHLDVAERLAVDWFGQPVKLIAEYSQLNASGLIDAAFEFEPIPYSSVGVPS
jgi:hypothetical protein